MVSSVSRNWVAGMASGMDTQGMIDKIMNAERTPLKNLQKKRNTLETQKSLLQSINLKLFELQNKSTDLVFSRTFNSKKVNSSNDKLISATASTGAKVGSYNIMVKQIATSTQVSSAFKLASPMELGNNIQSSRGMGGANLTLGAIGIAGVGNLDVTITGGGTHTLTLGLNATSTVQNLVSTINSKIGGVTELKGKVAASYNEQTGKIQFNLLDSAKTVTVADNAGSIMSDLYGGATQTIDRFTPVKISNSTLRSGLQTTLNDLQIAPGSQFTLARSTGESMTLDLTGLPGTTTVQELENSLNHQLDLNATFTKGGVVTGKPSDRKMEFRFDDSTGKLQLVNTDSSDLATSTISDVAGDFSLKVLGNSVKTSTPDSGVPLVSETLATTVTGGYFTVDGTRIAIDTSADSMQKVLARITSTTNINAEYDSATDRIRLTRKDGTSTPIGMGSSADTSNFLSATRLMSGNQASAALQESTGGIGAITSADANSQPLSALAFSVGAPIGAGPYRLKVTVGDKESILTYSGADSLNSVLDKVKNLEGIKDAYYDSSSQKVRMITDDKGAAASLKVEDLDSGNLLTNLKFTSGAVSGSNTGPALESTGPLSGIKTTTAMNSAGFATTITAGSFTINGVNFSAANPGTQNLQGIIDAINNNSKVGVTATFDAEKGQMVLTAKSTGNTSISLGAPSDTSNFLSVVGLTSSVQDVGQNAIFNVQGVFSGLDQVRQSNEVTDIASGVTFSLKGVTTGVGETVGIETDTAVARKAIDDFVKSYNDTMELVYTKLTEKRDYSLEALDDETRSALSASDLEAYDQKYQVGILSNDSTLTTVRSRMRVVMGGMVGNVDKAFKALNDIGISTGVVGSGYQDTQKGLMKVTDEDKLTSALRDNPDKVADLFAKDSTSESGQGIARRLKSTLNEFTKTDGLLTRRVGRSGVSSSNSEMDKQIRLINDQLTKQESRMSAREDALVKQFAALETAMSRYQSQSQSLSNQLSSLSGSSK